MTMDSGLLGGVGLMVGASSLWTLSLPLRTLGIDAMLLRLRWATSGAILLQISDRLAIASRASMRDSLDRVSIDKSTKVEYLGSQEVQTVA